MSFAVLGLAALAADATAQAPCGGGIQQFTPRFAISGGAAGPDGRSLWLLSGSPSSSFGRLLRVNLATGAAARPIRLPGSPSDIAIGFRAVSVTAVVGPRQEPVFCG